MIKLEELTNNDQWYIEPSEAQELIESGDLLNYKFCKIELGKIKRWESKEKRVLKLKETVNYRFLSNLNSKQALNEYTGYCKDPKNLADNPNRSPEIFMNLYNKILKEGYDIKKGIIAVDQNNTICIGLHRACIMLFIHGENFEIPVLKLNLKSSILHKYPFLIPIYKFFNYIRKKLKIKTNE